jgi:NifU-like protein
MGWEYSAKTKQLFMDAVQGKPGTHLGEIENPDGMGEHGSISCGDAMRFTFRVKRHPSEPTLDLITEAKYLTFGCTSAIASSEALCEIIEAGQYTPITALQIQNKDIVDYLEGLPEQKIHCSVMGAEALEAAVYNWAQRRGVDLKKLGIDMHDEESEEGRVVCKCFSITEPYLKRKIRELNLRTIPQITAALKAGGGCMSCHHVPGGLQDILDEVWGGQAAMATAKPLVPLSSLTAEPTRDTRDAAEFSPFQFAKKVERVIDEFVRPGLKRDGGDIEVVDIKGTMIYCGLRGACKGCAGATYTMKLMVERILKEQVDERIRVIEV